MLWAEPVWRAGLCGPAYIERRVSTSGEGVLFDRIFISICTGTEGQRDLATEQDKNMLRVHHALESCGLSPSGVPDVTVERAQHDNILDVSKGES